MRSFLASIRVALIAACALIGMLAPCGGAPAAHADGLTLQTVSYGVFNPTSMTNAGDGSGRLFITEFAGRIKAWNGTQLTTFLDITAKVKNSGEDGLLGLAFDPDYEDNGYFYVTYLTLTQDSVLERYTVSADPNVADVNSAVLMKSSPRPFGAHHAGHLAFGPDGYLYVSMGDSGTGGPGGDPLDKAQDTDSLWGKIWRLDVDAPPEYIPLTNPFTTGAGADEIWAMGFRNPYKFAFDRVFGDLFIGDVGEHQREEVDFQAGSDTTINNYGWDNMEGTLCFEPPTGCDTAGMTLPIIEYDHVTGCSITGGYRYRGPDPLLHALYIYGDFCTGNIWGAFDNGSGWTSILLADAPFAVASFGESESGELYVNDFYGERFLRLQTDADIDDDGTDNAADNCPWLANAGQADVDGDQLGDVCEPLLGTVDGQADSDGDGCLDGREARGATFSPQNGGDRDPRSPWDFYDVNGDEVIDLHDTLDILAAFGLAPGQPGYDPIYDRYAPDLDRRWRTAAADAAHKGIDLQDAIVNLQSFGHNCS